jgi:hypothetical protein
MDYREVLLQMLMEKVAGEKPVESVTSSLAEDFIGKICMVRAETAGVFYGTVSKVQAGEIIMNNARRVWYWEGAASLSQLATEGTSKPENCKFPCEVSQVYLDKVCEIIPMTDRAILSLNGVSIWKK